MRLNTKNWKKISQDSKFATFKDKHGNEMRIAHSRLSAQLKAELDALPVHLADGEEVKKKDDKGPAIVKEDAKAIEKGATESGWQPKQMWENMKEGLKKPRSMTKGGEITTDDIAALDNQNASTADVASMPAAADPNVVSEGIIPRIGSEMQTDALPTIPTMEEGMLPRRGSEVFNQMLQGNSQEASRLPMSEPDAGLAATAAPVDLSKPAALDGAESEQAKAFKMQQQGLQEAYNAQVGKAQADADIAHKNQIAQQTLLDDFTKNHNQLTGEMDAAVKDIKAGHIDQDRLWANRGTVGKIATVIGLLAGGIATRPGEENPALKVLNQQIDRDIEEQKANLHNKNNVLSALVQQTGSLRAGIEASRALQLGVTADKLAEAAAKAASPMAKANLLMASGQLKERSSGILAKEAAQKTFNSIINKGSQDPTLVNKAFEAASKFMKPEELNHLRERYIPGVGFANTSKDRNELVESKTSLDGALNSINELNKINNLSAAEKLTPAVRAKAQTYAQGLVGLLRPSILGPGVVDKNERKILEGIAADPTKVFSLSSSNLARYKAISEKMKNDFASAAKARGVNLPSQQSGNPEAKKQEYLNWAKKNPNDPRAKAILGQR